ncbi:hydroxyproline-rich glycoprotein family protein [Forsythia ovata]|uniref:Hydroxyproline-rich glycoprotein family protein n=1 Tax=Forsythia ovata TaxID=205694 RepID=A0ABD1PLK4_9LAMI
MPMKGETTPPPRIGKIGPYTVFVTPPATPKPSPELNSPNKTAPVPVHGRIAVGTPPVQSPPPVQAPPPQFDKEKSSSFGFLWDAVVKVQNAHESLDEHVAHWFGLNQSKYQWALDDYYETNGKNQGEAKAQCKPGKRQNV